MVHLENDNEYDWLPTTTRAAGAVMRVAAARRINYTATEIHNAAMLLFSWEQAAAKYGITLKDLAVCNVGLPASALDLIHARTRSASTP